jgi:type VI secretion system secreted protein Hcp
MPLSPILIIYGPDGKPIRGPVDITDRETPDLTGCYGEEFEHTVYIMLKDAFYTLVYGVDFVRKHTPIRIVKQIDKMSVPLMNYFKSGTFLPKAEIHWYSHNENHSKTEEYFRMTLEHVRLHSVFYKMPNVKDATFERYNHLEELQLMYQKITWKYLKGNLLYTDIWKNAFGELDTKDFSEKKEDSNDETVFAPVPESLKLKFTTGTFITPKDGFQFDKKASVKFTFSTNRSLNEKENKFYTKLYVVYNGATEDMHITQEGRPREKEDFWITDFTLRKPEAYLKDNNRAADAKVEYYAVVENAYAVNDNFKSDSVTLPSKKELNFTFEDEETRSFSDASFNIKSSETVSINKGSIVLLEDQGRLDIIFPMAMNYQPGSMPTIA